MWYGGHVVVEGEGAAAALLTAEAGRFYLVSIGVLVQREEHYFVGNAVVIV
jgi:hypothetical protein